MFIKRHFVGFALLLSVASTLFVGTRSFDAQASARTLGGGEVVTLSGVLADGESIPLPIYADGTIADEAECSWIVSLNHIGSGPPIGGGGFWREEECSAVGRVIRCRAYSYSPPSIPQANWIYITGSANYLIIATRGAGTPTAARVRTFGGVKVGAR